MLLFPEIWTWQAVVAKTVLETILVLFVLIVGELMAEKTDTANWREDE